PQRYVSVACNAVLEWKNSVEVAASSLVTEAPSLEGATAYLNYVLGVTDQMLAHVHAVGVPTAPNGRTLQSDVIHGLVTARSALRWPGASGQAARGTRSGTGPRRTRRRCPGGAAFGRTPPP